MVAANTHDSKDWGEWHPAPAALAPINTWPPRPAHLFNWLFNFPGYLWPANLIVFGITIVTWSFLTPEISAMKSLETGWIAIILARNFLITILLYGGLHLYCYVFKAQGSYSQFTSRPLATDDSRFLFRNQVKDNMFHTLVYGVPIFTAYEVLTYWFFANGYLGFIDLGGNPFLFWAWAGLLVFVAPMIHSVHFYFAHRLLHTKLLYKSVHSLHHRNVVVGPWSGLDMHPLEHLLYFSTVVVQWLLALHPVNALFQIHIAALYPATGHLGFERLKIGNSAGVDVGGRFHYLHHKYFECNYGTSLIALDRLFGSYHDGTEEADAALRERRRARGQAVSAQS